MSQISLKKLTLAIAAAFLWLSVWEVKELKAGQKSAIAPEIIESPETIKSPAEITPEPVVNLVSPTSNQAATPISPNLNLPTQSIPQPTAQPIINIQARTSSNLVEPPVSKSVNNSAKLPSSEKVEVFLENRSSGCRAFANNTINLQTNLCAKPEPPRDYRLAANGFNGGFRTDMRRLSTSELQKLQSMSLPGNGDRYMLFPLAIPAMISSGFGYRVHPITGASRLHQGVDLAAAEGTPVLAAFSGTVEVAGWMGGLGMAIVISHGNTYETRYGHLSQILVQPGQQIKQGTAIGLVGSTGMSTGAHLHFELWQKIAGEWLAMDSTNQILLALEQLNRYLAGTPTSKSGRS